MEFKNLTPQQIADEQLRICSEWISYNLEPTFQKPIKSQVEKFMKECRINVTDPLIDLS